MKFIKSSLLILFLVSCDDIGKGYQWKNSGFSSRFGTIGYDYGWNASYSPFDEGIIVVGQSSINIAGQSDMWAIKTDKDGLLKWKKRFGGGKNDVGYDVIATSDGGFLFVGYTWSYGNNQQVYIVKTDFHGNTEWQKTYGGSMWDVGNAVIEINGGGYLVAGYSNSPGISSGNTDMYLLRINSNGELIWQSAYGNKAFPNHEWAQDLIETSDGEFIVVGMRDRYNKGALNGLIIRIDGLGSLLWEKEFGDENQVSESIYSISKAMDGNYYLCTSFNSINKPKVFQGKVLKMDSVGNVGWARIINSNSREYHQFRASSTISGDVVIVGSSAQQLPSGHKEDAFITKINNVGDILWSYPYGSSDEDDWGWSIFETPKSDLVFVGSTKSFGASLFDIYLVGTNADGIR